MLRLFPRRLQAVYLRAEIRQVFPESLDAPKRLLLFLWNDFLPCEVVVLVDDFGKARQRGRDIAYFTRRRYGFGIETLELGANGLALPQRRVVLYILLRGERGQR